MRNGQGRLMACLFATLLASPIAAQSVPGVDIWLVPPVTAAAINGQIEARAIADPSAYLVIFRVTSDNRVVVVTPRTPYGTYRVPANGFRSQGLDASFRAESINGIGRLFAVASYTPFDFSRVRIGDSWNTQRLTQSPALDPMDVAEWFIRQIVPSRTTPYGFNDVAYYVGVTPPASAQGQAMSSYGASGPVTELPPNYNYDYNYLDGGIPWDAYPTSPYYGYSGYYLNGYYYYDLPPVIIQQYRVRRVCADGTILARNGRCPALGIRPPGTRPPSAARRSPTPRGPTPFPVTPMHPSQRPAAPLGSPQFNAERSRVGAPPAVGVPAPSRPLRPSPPPMPRAPASAPSAPRTPPPNRAPVGTAPSPRIEPSRPIVRPTPVPATAPVIRAPDAQAKKP